MKTIFTVLALLALKTSFAQDFTPIKNNEVSLSKANAKIVSVDEICPAHPGRPTCMAFGARVNILVGLNGCVDGFGGYFSKFEVIDGKGVLYFGAINLGNKQSIVTRCIQQSARTVSVFVPFKGEIELVNMNYTSNPNN